MSVLEDARKALEKLQAIIGKKEQKALEEVFRRHNCLQPCENKFHQLLWETIK